MTGVLIQEKEMRTDVCAYRGKTMRRQREKAASHEPRREAPEEINPAHLELGLPTSGL